jgi:V/A-type H+-transporting ATPase subunit E
VKKGGLTVGYQELLRVIGEEAAREARDVRAEAERECARIMAECRTAAEAARAALVARTAAEIEARVQAARGAQAQLRERALLVAQRRHLDALREAALAALARAGGPALDARLLAELIPEAGEGPLTIIVDPDAEEACRAALERLAPSVASRTEIRAAPARRGGVELVAGRRVLDDTLEARLERLWPDAEAELATILFGEDPGAAPGPTSGATVRGSPTGELTLAAKGLRSPVAEVIRAAPSVVIAAPGRDGR